MVNLASLFSLSSKVEMKGRLPHPPDTYMGSGAPVLTLTQQALSGRAISQPPGRSYFVVILTSAAVTHRWTRSLRCVHDSF